MRPARPGGLHEHGLGGATVDTLVDQERAPLLQLASDALRAFELTERCVGLVLSVMLAIAAVVCALRGSPWPVSTGTGFTAIGFRVLTESYRGGRKPEDRDPGRRWLDSENLGVR
jgi:hypothetical protein